MVGGKKKKKQNLYSIQTVYCIIFLIFHSTEIFILILCLSDHFDYLKHVIGAEHIGIGSDYDGASG